MPHPIPEGFATLTPSVLVNDAAKAIELYSKAFGAKEVHRMADPTSGKIMHACLEIGTSKLFLADFSPETGCMTPTVSSFYVYVPNVDTTFAQAKQAGLEESYPVKDMFWGDRTGSMKDPFGNMWTLATHVRDVSEEEMEEGMKSFGQKAA